MKKLIIAFTVILFIGLTSCKKEEINPYEEYTEDQLATASNQKFSEIQNLINQVTCNNPIDWKIMEINTVCGKSHITYHKSIDTKKLNSLVEDYHKIIEIYTPKISFRINCIPYKKPLEVICLGGKAELKYQTPNQ